MHRLLAILVFAATTSALPQMSMAQHSQQTQQGSVPMQQRVQQDLEQEGFTDVRIMVSSFLVRARDRHGNPVMMVINPDSVTAVTAIPGSAQRSGQGSGQGSSQRADQGSTDRLGLSRTQRNEIYQDLTNQPKESEPGFSPRVGEQVPSDLQLKPLPHSVTGQVPEVGSYQYAMLGRQVLIVDPDSKRIVDIVTE
jgi:hypothetical protein